MIFSKFNVLSIVELLGVLAFAFTGIIEARRKGMDMIGVYTVSMIAAFGGGTVRDLIIGRYPLYWVLHSGYSMLLLGFAIATTPLSKSFYENHKISEAVITLDALGLGLFSAVGASVASHAGCGFYISVLLGVVTGVFGGIIRDIICNEIPDVFRRNELYATCAAIGSAVFLTCRYISISEPESTLISIATTTMLRMFSIKCKIRLPF